MMRDVANSAYRHCAKLVFAVLLGCGISANAKDLPESGDTQVDTVHDAVSEQVALTATWLDSFFANEQYQAETSETILRWSVTGFAEKGEDVDFSNKLKIRLRLPGLKNRASLFINSQWEDIDTTDSFAEELEDDFSGQDEDNVSVGVRYSFADTRDKNSSIKGGIRFRSGSPVAFVHPRYRYFKEFSEFDLRFTQEARWFSDSGLEVKTELQLERPVWKRWLFRSSARAVWYEDEEGLFPALGFNWRRPIDEKRAVSVTWDNYFNTQPDAVLDSTVFRVRYRQQIWRRWLSFEVAPQIVFPRDEDYEIKPGLLVTLEAEFRRMPTGQE